MVLARQIDCAFSGFVDNSGNRLAGGTIGFYESDGITLATIWEDADKNTIAANPYTLDDKGTATIFGDQTYSIILKDSDGNTLETPDGFTYTISDDQLDKIIATDFGSMADGYATIEAAIAFAAGDNRTIYLSSGNWIIDTSLTQPSNINFEFEYGANFRSNTSADITYNGTITAPPFSINHSTLGTVTFGVKIPYVPTVWTKGGALLGNTFYNSLTTATANITTANITTVDLGTNTITDGNFTGSWSFNSGNLSGINSITSTASPFTINSTGGDLNLTSSTGLNKIIYYGSDSFQQFSSEKMYFLCRPSLNQNYDLFDFRLESTLASKNTSLTATWGQFLGWDNGSNSSQVFKMVHSWVDLGTDNSKSSFYTRKDGAGMTETLTLSSGTSATIVSNLVLTASSISTVSGNLSLSPQSGQAVLGNTVISSGQINTSGGDLTVGAAGNISFISTASFGVNPNTTRKLYIYENGTQVAGLSTDLGRSSFSIFADTTTGVINFGKWDKTTFTEYAYFNSGGKFNVSGETNIGRQLYICQDLVGHSDLTPRLGVFDQIEFTSNKTEYSTMYIAPRFNFNTYTLTHYNYFTFTQATVLAGTVTNYYALGFNAALGTHVATTNTDKTGNAKSGTIKVYADGTLYHIQLYANS